MGRPHDHAVPPGEDTARLSRYLNVAHEPVRQHRRGRPGACAGSCSSRGSAASTGGSTPSRRWPTIRLDDRALTDIRDAHPLAAGMPVIRRLLVESAAEAGLVVAVSDAAGKLL